jgi:GNAT superfamily N-acetyltransferase
MEKNEVLVNLRSMPLMFSVSLYEGGTKLSLAELSTLADMGFADSYKSALAPYINGAAWYYFNRINVPRKLRNDGRGTRLMTEVCRVCDEHRINILCDLNPYDGPEYMEPLRRFYRRFGFIDLPIDDAIDVPMLRPYSCRDALSECAKF